ncbi:hypothetical protein AXF06_01060 [Staphylococcus aureus]|nr:hypothetical protein [Staphylococcus aureus]MCL9701683.1 hypothetical protein [Staphylococcus aureus]
MSKEKVFLYVGVTPTFIVGRNWESNFSMLGPRQLALSVEIGVPISFRISFRNSLCWDHAVN